MCFKYAFEAKLFLLQGGFTVEEEIAWCTKKLQQLLATKYRDSKDIKAGKFHMLKLLYIFLILKFEMKYL